jgi:hypothetical protein
MRLSHKGMHGPLAVTCAISPHRNAWACGEACDKTQASFSVALPVTDMVTLAQLDADP